MAAAIRRGDVSSEALVRAHLERIDRIAPLNAVVATCPERALEEARRADAAEKDPGARPLQGVPVTIKDSLDTEGLCTTWGTAGRQGHVPDHDATVVARLRAAGAIVLGKTNTPELTLSFTTHNDVYGLTKNPYDPDRTPGGSSGGAAVAVATGAAALELGSDLGGSIRVPAHFCGVAGIKPTAGRVSRTGHALPWGGPLDVFGTIGPLARRVDDLTLALRIIQGPDGVDPSVLPMALADPAAIEPKGLRVAVHFGHDLQPAEPAIQRAIKRAALALTDAGVDVEEVKPPALHEAWELTSALFGVAGGPLVSAILAECGTEQASILLAGHEEWAEGWTAEELVLLLHRIDGCRSRIRRFLAQWDALLGPIASWTAPTHTDALLRDYAYGYPFNLAGAPAVVVPVTHHDGLPVGVQIAARPLRDDLALGLARLVEQVGDTPPPPLPATDNVP